MIQHNKSINILFLALMSILIISVCFISPYTELSRNAVFFQIMFKDVHHVSDITKDR